MPEGYAIQAIQAVLSGQRAYCKFLAANDTGLTGGHQAGIYISKPSITILFDEPGIKGTNKEKWVRKGSGVYVEGKIRTRNYDDQSGVKRYVTEIHADRIEFYSTGSRPADGGNTTAQGGSMQPNVGQGQPAQPTTAPNTAYQQPAASQPSAFSESSDADDLPF